MHGPSIWRRNEPARRAESRALLIMIEWLGVLKPALTTNALHRKRLVIWRKAIFFCWARLARKTALVIELSPHVGGRLLRGATAWLAGVEREEWKEFRSSSEFWLLKGENAFRCGIAARRATLFCFIIAPKFN